jgi:glyoxylase-like metal-dependent hydrolase (beta-lactamase superfamily II)
MNLKKISNILIMSLFILLFGAILSTAETKSVPLSEKVYILEGLAESGNVAFLVTEAGVLVVDAGDSPASGLTIIEKVREVTAQPIRFVVLTHYHGDHCFGLQAFPAETLIIAQENLPQNQKHDAAEIKVAMEKYLGHITEIKENFRKLGKKKTSQRAKDEERLKKAEEKLAFYGQLQIVPPHILFHDKLVLQLGGEIIEIINPGPAHTNDNALVYFPGQRIIYMGDMVFHKLHPYIDWQAGSNTANWITQLEKVAGWPLEKVIPGHGAVADKEALAEQARYLTDLRAMVAPELTKGASLEALKKSLVLAQWSNLGFSDMWPYAIEAVVHELGGK